jgi:hypothetical protein
MSIHIHCDKLFVFQWLKNDADMRGKQIQNIYAEAFKVIGNRGRMMERLP